MTVTPRGWKQEYHVPRKQNGGIQRNGFLPGFSTNSVSDYGSTWPEVLFKWCFGCRGREHFIHFFLSVCVSRDVETSLDSRAALANNDYAVENIDKLSAFENVEILLKVDATNLTGPRIFDWVIFNFPHTGGKSNIGKSRELLERFFASAAHHVDDNGDICVSLCQGQGGTPLDNPRREHGNTWQVVSRAAKAG